MTNNAAAGSQPLNQAAARDLKVQAFNAALRHIIDLENLQVFTWDAPHHCGITDHFETAIGEIDGALIRADVGAIAVLRGGRFHSSGLSERVIGRAQRTERAVAWIPDESGF